MDWDKKAGCGWGSQDGSLSWSKLVGVFCVLTRVHSLCLWNLSHDHGAGRGIAVRWQYFVRCSRPPYRPPHTACLNTPAGCTVYFGPDTEATTAGDQHTPNTSP